MPFTTPWKIPKKGDLIYGVHSDLARKWYIRSHEKFKGKVSTADRYAVLTNEKDKDDAIVSHSLLQMIQHHAKYKSILDKDRFVVDNNELVRRKCKSILEWAVLTNKTIHFVLDDLDLDAVVSKNYKGKGNKDKNNSDSTPKNRSITGSELRWIYRNRYRESVVRNVQFWILGTPCPPPWECDTTTLTMTGEKIYSKLKWELYIKSLPDI